MYSWVVGYAIEQGHPSRGHGLVENVLPYKPSLAAHCFLGPEDHELSPLLDGMLTDLILCRKLLVVHEHSHSVLSGRHYFAPLFPKLWPLQSPPFPRWFLKPKGIFLFILSLFFYFNNCVPYLYNFPFLLPLSYYSSSLYYNE